MTDSNPDFGGVYTGASGSGCAWLTGSCWRFASWKAVICCRAKLGRGEDSVALRGEILADSSPERLGQLVKPPRRVIHIGALGITLKLIGHYLA
jgi:hypothetical protein